MEVSMRREVVVCFTLLTLAMANVVRSVAESANEPGHWAFQPLRGMVPPKVRDAAWPKSDIDRFILAKLEDDKLSPARDAARASLLRRVTFDLIGLPPTPEEIEAFCVDSVDDVALTKFIDRLLQSPEFGARRAGRCRDGEAGSGSQKFAEARSDSFERCADSGTA